MLKLKLRLGLGGRYVVVVDGVWLVGGNVAIIEMLLGLIVGGLVRVLSLLTGLGLIVLPLVPMIGIVGPTFYFLVLAMLSVEVVTGCWIF